MAEGTMNNQEIADYKQHIAERLGALSPFLVKYALGDFSQVIQVPEEEDEFTELTVGLVLMVDDIQEIMRESEVTINALRQVQTSLRESEIRYSTLVENLPHKLFATDLNSVYLSCNENYAQDLGITAAEIVGKTVNEVHPREVADQHRADDQRIIKAGVAKELEEKFERDGQEIWVHKVKTPIRDAQGSITGLLGVMWDITERKRTEAELLLKNIVFETSVAANSIADNDGTITHVNPAFVKLWGYQSKEDAIGNSVASFFVNVEDAAPVMEGLNTTGQWEGEFLAKRQDGKTFISYGLATVVQNENGEMIGYQSANLDVTAQKQAEDELRRRMVDLERFNRLAVDRELRMIELKRQVNALSQELGREMPYDISFANA